MAPGCHAVIAGLGWSRFWQLPLSFHKSPIFTNCSSQQSSLFFHRLVCRLKAGAHRWAVFLSARSSDSCVPPKTGAQTGCETGGGRSAPGTWLIAAHPLRAAEDEGKRGSGQELPWKHHIPNPSCHSRGRPAPLPRAACSHPPAGLPPPRGGLPPPPGGLAWPGPQPRALTALVAHCRGSGRCILPGAEQAPQALHRCPALLLLLSRGKGPQAGVPREVSCAGPDKPVPRAAVHAAGPNTPLRAHLQAPRWCPDTTEGRGRCLEQEFVLRETKL